MIQAYLALSLALQSATASEPPSINEQNDLFKSYITGCAPERTVGLLGNKDNHAVIRVCANKDKATAATTIYAHFYHIYRRSDFIRYSDATGYGGKQYRVKFNQDVVTCHSSDVYDYCTYAESAFISLTKADLLECKASGISIKLHGAVDKIVDFPKAECAALVTWAFAIKRK